MLQILVNELLIIVFIFIFDVYNSKLVVSDKVNFSYQFLIVNFSFYLNFIAYLFIQLNDSNLFYAKLYFLYSRPRDVH